MSEAKSTHVRTRQRKRGGQGTVTKTVTKTVSGEEVSSAESNEKFAVESCINPAYVGTKVGFTKNLGNYESVRVDVTITVPVEATEQAIREGFDKVSLLAEEFINIEVDNAQAAVGR